MGSVSGSKSRCRGGIGSEARFGRLGSATGRAPFAETIRKMTLLEVLVTRDVKPTTNDGGNRTCRGQAKSTTHARSGIFNSGINTINLVGSCAAFHRQQFI
jgi:hypothetical protein